MNKFMRLGIGAVGAMLLTGVASAAPITINQPLTDAQPAPDGSITLDFVSDSGTSIDMILNATGLNSGKVLEIFFNYTGTNTLAFSKSGPGLLGNTCLGNGTNKCKADGYPGLFDFSIKLSDFLKGSTYTIDITGETDSSKFFALDSLDKYQAAAHFSSSLSCDEDSEGKTVCDSTWVGGPGGNGDGGGPGDTPVSEPGSLALLGLGLVGMGLARRRRKIA